MKAALTILVLVGIYLFYPLYDLAVKDSIFAKDFHIVGRDFLTLGMCVEAVRAESAEVYSCLKKNHWDEIFSGYTQYNPEIREIRKQMAGDIVWRQTH